MTLSRAALCIMITFLLSGCAAGPAGRLKKEDDAASLCPRVQSLVAQHKNGFVQLRGSENTTRYASVWTAREQLVGRDCQIWGWGHGSYGYVCSVLTPDQQIAIDYYGKAREFTSHCLGQLWSMLESVGQSDNAREAIFSRPDSNTIIAVRAVPVRGIAASQWTTYYYIGDRAHLQ